MSMTLPAGMLAAQRTTFETSLTRTLTIPGGVTVTNNGDGTYTETPDAGTANVPCSFMAREQYERIVGGALTATGDYVLTIKTGVTLTPNMAVTVDVDATFGEPAETFQLVGQISGPPRNYLQLWTATKG